MEWVETTAKSVEQAKELALDQLGVAGDDAEFDVVEEPKSGLFGRVRGEARVRARVKPTAVRPKQDRRNRGRGKGRRDDRTQNNGEGSKNQKPRTQKKSAGSGDGSKSKSSRSSNKAASPQAKESRVEQESTVSPQEVSDAAVAFMSGLAEAFGPGSTTTVDLEDTDIEVRVDGDGLGLLIGPGGRTLASVQDLARVASQRRLGDHDTRLRIDVSGYREKRRVALVSFTTGVAEQVISTGDAKALEPMPSADRKVVHDAVAEIDGVSSRSEGDDPSRRVVIDPD